MYKIALVCENGASTGMVMRKMQKAAEEKGLEVEIEAYPYTQMENFIAEKQAILFGPQLAFKKDLAMRTFPDHAAKISVIDMMDFGMMNGEKILMETIARIDK